MDKNGFTERKKKGRSKKPPSEFVNFAQDFVMIFQSLELWFYPFFPTLKGNKNILQIENLIRFDSRPGSNIRKLLAQISDCKSVLQTGAPAIAASQHYFSVCLPEEEEASSSVRSWLVSCVQLLSLFVARPRAGWSERTRTSPPACCCPRPCSWPLALSVVLKRLSIDDLNDQRCHVCADILSITDTGKRTDRVSHVSRQVKKQVGK